MTPDEAHQQLLLALTVERYDRTWWNHPEHQPDTPPVDTPEQQARRRHQLDEAWRADADTHPDRRVIHLPDRTA